MTYFTFRDVIDLHKIYEEKKTVADVTLNETSNIILPNAAVCVKFNNNYTYLPLVRVLAFKHKKMNYYPTIPHDIFVLGLK